MSTIKANLLAQMQTLDEELRLPEVLEVVMPHDMLSSSEANAKYDKFGMLLLEDNSSGLFYRLLGMDTERIEDYREVIAGIRGQPAIETAQLINQKDEFIRGVGLACINAVTQHLYRRATFDPIAKGSKPEETPDSATTSIQRDKPIGLVGYFAQQVRSLRANGHSVVVLELDSNLFRSEQGLIITDDIEQLAICDPIYCTGSTLINQTLDAILARLASGRHMELVGPSAGCLPDILFKQGIDRVGGSMVVDPKQTKSRIQQGCAWSDGVKKFSLTSSTYPGLDELLYRTKKA